MQKSRPLGVTILAYWAIAGSGVMFALNTIDLAGYAFTEHAFIITLGSLSFLTAPLGGNYVVNSLVAFPVAAFFAFVGLYTFKGRRWAWFANVGMSMAAFVQYAVALPLFVLAGLIRGNEDMIFLAPSIAFIAASMLRLYYLFRPNVRDFFDTWSIFAQKRTA